MTNKIINLIIQYIGCVFPFGIIDKIRLRNVLPRNQITAFYDTCKVAAVKSRIAIAHTVFQTVGLLLHNADIGIRSLDWNVVLGKSRSYAACREIVDNIAHLESVHADLAKAFCPYVEWAIKAVIVFLRTRSPHNV